jgi:C-terminal processing protease CtpA/Prc
MRLLTIKLILVFIVGMGLLACKKELQEEAVTSTPAVIIDKIKDSSLLYARDIYLWYSQIPSTFNAQSYADPNKIMEAIRAYSTEPGFSTPVDRWSFAYKQKDWDNVSSGVTQDFGLSVFFRAADDLRVKLVEKASPAGNAAIHRGWRITKINGNANINTSNIDFIVKGVFESSTSSFTFQKPDGSTTDITLSGATYQEHPVMLDSVYTVGANKVGYLVFNSFLGDTTEIYNEFNRVFNKFTQQNVQDVVVDLRYNGGGYVSVQEKLANYLINATANGNVMMNQEYNNKYSRYNSTTRYKKLGSLNASRLFFIVSSSTASASELLINNLQPYMNVKLVGPSNTYGKPVGFFPIPVGDWYVFPVSSRTTNKNGEGNYFSGITVNNTVADGLDKDWGDINESSFASTLKFISTGAFRGEAMQENYRENADVRKGNSIINEPAFKGAILTRSFK